VIVLDTNVVSECMRPAPSAAALEWLDRQAAQTLFITSTSIAELVCGIHLLPIGKRRSRLAEALMALLEELFGERILDFDKAAALAYGPLVARARQSGHTIAIADAQIAAVAAVHGFSVATRDAAFEAAGVRVIDPWRA
jgi:toxin FitB